MWEYIIACEARRGGVYTAVSEVFRLASSWNTLPVTRAIEDGGNVRTNFKCLPILACIRRLDPDRAGGRGKVEGRLLAEESRIQDNVQKQ